MKSTLRLPPVLLWPVFALATLVAIHFSQRLLAASLFTGCGGERPASTDPDAEQRVVAIINQARADASLPPLKQSVDLSYAARYHAVDMTQDNYFEHDSYDLVDGTLVRACAWDERVRTFFPTMGVAENIAWGYHNPDAVMEGWMTSEGHRRNILGGSWEVGVGRHNDVWVVDFSRRSDNFPLIINRDAPTTTETVVTIHIYGAWSQMRLRSDGGVWGDWQPFMADFEWHLPDTPGAQTVEAELQGGALTTISSDTIELIDPTNTPTPTPTPSPTATLIATTPPCTTCLDAQIALEGRPAAPNARLVVPIVAKLIPLGGQGDPPVAIFTRVTSDNGIIRLDDLTPGPYELLVRGMHTLQRRTEVTITTGTNYTDVGLLREGDVLTNNQVDLLDFSFLSPAYAACQGVDNYRAQADLNDDGCVEATDLDLLRGNFGQSGDEAQSLLAAALSSPPPALTLQHKQSGDRFVVTVQINEEAGPQVNAGALYLNFNPQLLYLAGIAGHSDFTTTLLSTVDNQQGHVDFVAGMLDRSLAPPFEFARLTFEVLQPFDQATLLLETAERRRSDLAADGNSLAERTGNVARLFSLQEGEAPRFTSSIYH